MTNDKENTEEAKEHSYNKLIEAKIKKGKSGMDDEMIEMLTKLLTCQLCALAFRAWIPTPETLQNGKARRLRAGEEVR